MGDTTKVRWPVIKDLPEEERQPFSDWLYGQTVPLNADGSWGYYACDYERWKAGLPVID